MLQNLVFYDGECGLCDHIVQILLKVDREKQFVFAPLQGETAKTLLQDVPNEVKSADSLILITDYQSQNKNIYLFGKAAFRICWILGSWWMLLGWISFLPGLLYDWGYRLVARNRHRLFEQVCTIPDESQKDRFLP